LRQHFAGGRLGANNWRIRAVNAFVARITGGIMAAAENTSVADKRTAAVTSTVARIHEIAKSQGINSSALEEIRGELSELAAQRDLFPAGDFPAPTDGDTTRRHILSEDADQTFALYMNLVMPGHYSRPHNHTTWASVLAIEGEEVNQFFRRADDGSTPGKATLEFEREVVVQPGIGVALMPDDILSIANKGSVPTMHLHM
jgi:predicted metal-dependent enzyme (double-stranded beta helix superfamily)